MTISLKEFTNFLFNTDELFDFKYATIKDNVFNLEDELEFPKKEYDLILRTSHLKEQYDAELERRQISERWDFENDNGNALDTILTEWQEQIII